MNISSFAKTSYNGGSAKSIYAGNLLMGRRPALKSTQDKMERQQKTQNQIDFFTNQKEKLKDMQCGTVEEIAMKLDMLHSYEEQIAAVKKQYNSEQMFHVLDEARELGEKIAEAAEKSAPKTAEERKEEMVEEALGLDENNGILDDMLDEVAKLQEELTDEALKEISETELDEIFSEEAAVGDMSIEEESIQEGIEEDIAQTTAEHIADSNLEMMKAEEKKLYKSIDVLI